MEEVPSLSSENKDKWGKSPRQSFRDGVSENPVVEREMKPMRNKSDIIHTTTYHSWMHIGVILLLSFVFTTSCTRFGAGEDPLEAASYAELSRFFQNPPDWAKPSGYWWWLNGNVDKEAITRDMEEFKEKGMGAVLLVNSGQWPQKDEAFKGPEFLSDEWLELYKHALKEADRMGIKVDVNIAPGWNMGGPWVTPDKACRWFLQSQTTIRGPQKFSGKLPLPGGRDGYDSPPQLGVKTYIDLPLEELDYRDAAVVAFRTPPNAHSGLAPHTRQDLPAKSNRLDADCWIPAAKVMSQTLHPWSTSEDDVPLRPEDVIDLTSRLGPEGTLEWDVPEGEWTVVRTGHRMTGAKLSVPMPGQGGLENDYLDRAGVELMFEKVGMVLIKEAGPLAGKSLRGFCSDSFECGYPNWTANLIKRFKQYRGYDPVPYLPVFKGWIVGSAEISDRFLYDYRKTVADCMADEHYGRFTELCHENGLMTRCEAAGPSWSGTMCMDGLKNLGRVDFPQGEFWRNEFLQGDQNMFGKQTASAAHIYGKRTASAEALTSGVGHWSGSPQNLKPDVDRAFCEGINCCVFCLMTCQRPVDGKPGYEYGAGTHFNPNVTWWDQAAGAWVGYINRCQTMLQSGLFVADVLYYNGDWAPNFVGPRYVDPDLGKGYDYDVCNAEVLLERLSVSEGRLVLPDGMSYRLLVLPDAKRMPVEVISKIEALVKAGATVVGPAPMSAPGLKDYPDCDSTVRRISRSLWGGIDGKDIVEHRVGEGRVVWGKSLRDILQDEGVVPDLEVSGQEDAFIDFIHRATDYADFYFLANRHDCPENVKISFRQQGRQPELWDPVSGQQRDLQEFTMKDEYTTVDLQFEPNASMFIVFAKPAGKAKGENFPDYGKARQVNGPWTVQFDKEWFYPLDDLSGKEAEGTFVFNELVDWTAHQHPAVMYFSGTAVYSTEFETGKDIMRNRQYWLDLGVVNVSASVRLNGIDLGVVWCSPWRVDASKAIKRGVNELQITVVNQWPNRLIGDGTMDEDQRRTRTNLPHYYRTPRKGSHQLYSSGLLGPVTLMTSDSGGG